MIDIFKMLMPGIVAVLYLATALLCWIDNDKPMALVWFCYGFANVGIIWAMVSR